MLAPCAAGAQEDDAAPAEDGIAEARRLFGEGVAHTQASRWADAASSFEHALALHAAPAIRYNLAAAWVELGRYRDAQAQIQAVRSDPETPANIAEVTRALEERIQRETASLTIALEGDTAGTDVTLDGDGLEAEWLTGAIPVAPGLHAVAALRDGVTLAEAEVMTTAGQPARVRLLVRAGGRSTSEPMPLTEDWRFWLAVGGGAVALAAIITVIAIVAGQAGGGSPPVVGNFNPGVLTW